MSKLYDALLRNNGSIPDLDPVTLIGEQPNTVSFPLPEAAPIPPPPQPSVVLEKPAVQATATLVDAMPIRTVRLHLPQSSPALPFGKDHWQANEQYRIIRTKILQHSKQPKMILVSSAGAGDGKSITAINLAGVLSLRSECRVLLVDGDFRKSAIPLHLGIPETPGLAEVLEGRCELHQAIVGVEESKNLFVMAAGKPDDNPAELLQSSRWPQTAALLRREFRFIIIDSPPIAAVADYDLLQAMCDGVIMVIRPDHTSRPACQRALESVPKDKMIGVLLNCVTDWFLGASYGYGYSSPYYGEK